MLYREWFHMRPELNHGTVFLDALGILVVCFDLHAVLKYFSQLIGGY